MRMNEKRLFFCSEQDEFGYMSFGIAYLYLKVAATNVAM